MQKHNFTLIQKNHPQNNKKTPKPCLFVLEKEK